MTKNLGVPTIPPSIAQQTLRTEPRRRLSWATCTEFARDQLYCLGLMLFVFVLSLHPAWAKTVRPVKVVEGTALFDEMKTCALTWRYDKKSELLVIAEPVQMTIRTPAKIRDGYAEVRVQSGFHGLRVLSVTVPTHRDVWQQFSVQVRARPDVVRNSLERAWNVKFEETGVDGLEGKVAISFGSVEFRVG